ncbi:MAG TPA: M15 family metallopeptidase [Acidimicrobiales bacterium]|nr:M15 family metallopeptidase [Acidimicrobiales bacterium]
MPSTSPGESPEDQLSSTDLAELQNPVEDRFMRLVYERQLAMATRRGCSYLNGVPDSELEVLPSSLVRPDRRVAVRRDICADVTRMIVDARTALVTAQRTDVPGSTEVTDLRVLSGYRSAREQLVIWAREYPKYYQATQALRRGLPGGEHGARAADHLANYIGIRVFAPGYSPHQRGGTVDLTYRRHGHWSAADTSPTAIEAWQATWFYAWLRCHAHRYGFAHNPDLNEPWHWEYRVCRGQS